MLKANIWQRISENIVIYPTSGSSGYEYSFGSVLGIFFVIQVLTGFLLMLHYNPMTDHAFASVQHIMRDVNYGWLIRYMHMNGASFIFGLIYLHIGRALYMKSYLDFRSSVWYTGVLIFVLMMATAFLGYVLPWGQMSFWAATVITNIFTALPNGTGDFVVKWLWGDFGIGGPTLFRFFALHVILPAVVITGLIIVHINLLHDAGSSTFFNSTDCDDMISFYPYFYVKDLFLFGFIFWLFMLVVCYCPNIFTHAANFIEANSLSTPKHIVPEWYFLPFYAVLRAIPSKGAGILCLVLSIGVLFLFPKLDKTQRISSSFLIFFQVVFWLFVYTFCLLGFCGSKHAVEPYIWLSRFLTLLYFGLIFVIIVLSRVEKQFVGFKFFKKQ